MKKVQKITASLDYEQFSFKALSMIPEYTWRIADFERTETISKFAHEIGNKGQAFVPVVFKGGKLDMDDYKSQQFFALDFDENITWGEIEQRADKYNLPICFAYETFNSKNKDRFRVVFCNDIKITNLRVSEIMQAAIMEIFPEADRQCSNLTRIYLGGKNTFHEKPEARINILDLMLSLVNYYRDNDNINYNRKVKRFAGDVGLQLKNGLPHVELVDSEETESEDTGATPIYIYYIEDAVSSSIYKINLTNDIRRKYKNGRIIYNTSNIKTGERDLLRNFNFDDLAKRCKLFNCFVSGKHWCYHNELFGMATNLCCIKGGGKKFLETLNSDVNQQYYNYHDRDWGYYLNQIHNAEYLPKRCENFCPYADECNHAKNMIETAKTKRNTIIKLKSDKKYAPLVDAEADLIDKFCYVQGIDDNNIHIIKGQTGIGKSRIYIDMLEQGDKPCIVAVPTHRLKDEIYERCLDKGYNVIKTPQLPDDIPFEVWTEINRLYSVGANYSANRYIRRVAEEENIPELKDYVDELDKVKTFTGHIITTHDRFIFLDNTANHNLIIDEDIINVLLKINKVTVGDLLQIEQRSCIHPFDEDDVRQKIDKVLDADYRNVITVEPIANTEYIEDDISDYITSNVMGFLSSCVAYRYNTDSDIMSGNRYRDSDIITYVNRHSLPEQKIIILSATANEETYNAFFGDRVRFYNCIQAKYKGKLIQFPARSYSRHCIDNDPDLWNSAKKKVDNLPIITFKDKKENDTDLNFGGVEGINILDGQNIAVIGTPHLNELVYKLYAAALNIDISDTAMRYQEITWNNYNFYFMTYNNLQLRNIQLWLIQSELEQAIGRARLLRNNCTVYLFSNFPIEQAEFRYETGGR